MSVLQHFNAISKSRLAPYSALCKNAYPGELQFSLSKRTICIYTALQHRASIFSSLIQEIEISVRNEMTQIIKQNLTQNNDLLSHFCFLAIDKTTKLSPYSQNELKSCLIKLLNNTLPPNHSVQHLNNTNYAYQKLIQQKISADDIIANMTFGFWVNLINNNKRKNPNYLYWNNIFYRKIFNNRFNTILQLFNDLRDVRDFRNRLSHQDAVWSKSARTPSEALKNMEATYKRYDLLLSKLSPYRHHFRKVSTYLYWQESFNFDTDIFNAEIDSMMSNSFI